MAEYDRRRFGGASGAWVNEREIASVMNLLPESGHILDLGCGTGRLSRRLVARCYDVVLLDASDAMLARAVPTVGAPAVHFANLDGLVDSVARVLLPLTAIRALVRVEKHLPEAMRVRQFWSLVKPKD